MAPSPITLARVSGRRGLFLGRDAKTYRCIRNRILGARANGQRMSGERAQNPVLANEMRPRQLTSRAGPPRSQPVHRSLSIPSGEVLILQHRYRTVKLRSERCVAADIGCRILAGMRRTKRTERVTLQCLADDGSTYVTAMTAFSTNGLATAYLPSGSYRFAVASATAVYVDITGIETTH